jgi:hypothetical protein
MATQAGFLAQHCPVNTILAEHVINHVAVASSAEFCTAFFDLERVCSGRIVMTLVAHFLGNWHVDVIVKDPRPV